MTVNDIETNAAAWPTDRQARRTFGLKAVAQIRDELQVGAQESEALNRLSDRSIGALRSSGVLGIMTPDDLGGNAVDPVTAYEIVEAIGYVDPATAWTTAILLEGAGEIATYLEPEISRKVFGTDRLPLKAASLKPGKGDRRDGGYVISGRWDFVSGLHHADFVTAAFLIENDKGEQVQRFALMPSDEVEVLDDWRVLGMRGTGSSSFAASEVFVPSDFVYDPNGEPRRADTPLARLGMVPYILQMHSGMVLGAARRALDEIIAAAPKTRRGGRINLTQPSALAELTWFQRELGELDARVQAARAFAIAANARVGDVIDSGDRVRLELLDQMQTASSLAAKTSVEVVTRAFRHAGSAAIIDSSLLSRLLRDMNTICAHGVLSEAGFEMHGEFMLGLQDESNRRIV